LIEFNMDGYIARRTLDDGRALFVVPLLFGRARLGIGPAGSLVFDDIW
jgi:hypothetical protein